MKQNHFPLVMKLVASGTFFITILLILGCYFFPFDWLLACTISFGTTAYHFLMRLAVGYIIPKLTNYEFDYRHRWYQPQKWEAALYKKLNVKGWKGKLPTFAPEQFSLAEHDLHRIIQNMCGAEIVHETIMVLSFAPLLTVPLFGAFPVFLITSVLSALYDSIFVMAQRFNRPRLVRIYEKQEAKTHE